MKFAVGDTIRCVDSGNYNRLKNDGIYKIAKIQGEGEYEYIYPAPLLPGQGGFFPSRFELVEPASALNAHEYEEIIACQELYEKLK